MTADGSGSFWIGLAAVVGAVFFFGSMFVPVKRYRCGDCVFVQFMMGIGIIIVGFIVFVLTHFPPFYPLPMLGGLLWGLANSTAIMLTDTLGLALAMLIWKTVSCITGWAISRFGLFGINAAPPKSGLLNYLGLVLLVLGGIMFLFVRNQPSKKKPRATVSIFTTSIQVNDDDGTGELHESTSKSLMKCVHGTIAKHKRLISLVFCVIDGMLYGSRTAPVIYMQDHRAEFAEAPKSGSAYMFSYSIGTILTTSTIFIIYAIIKRGRPIIHPELVLPSLCCGVFWALGMIFLFVANDHLSQTIAYPIITVLPGGVAALWSVLYFKEIQGLRSISIMTAAIVVTLGGSILIALSKKFEV